MRDKSLIVDYAIIGAVVSNDIKMFKLFLEYTDYEKWIEETFEKAIKLDNYKYINYIAESNLSNKTKLYIKGLRYSIANDKINSLKIFIDLLELDEIPSNLLSHAAMNGNINVLKYIFNENLSDSYNDVAEFAASSGHVTIIAWLFDTYDHKYFDFKNIRDSSQNDYIRSLCNKYLFKYRTEKPKEIEYEYDKAFLFYK
jgi:hypothetical protein